MTEGNGHQADAGAPGTPRRAKAFRTHAPWDWADGVSPATPLRRPQPPAKRPQAA